MTQHARIWLQLTSKITYPAYPFIFKYQFFINSKLLSENMKHETWNFFPRQIYHRKFKTQRVMFREYLRYSYGLRSTLYSFFLFSSKYSKYFFPTKGASKSKKFNTKQMIFSIIWYSGWKNVYIRIKNAFVYLFLSYFRHLHLPANRH